MAAVPAAGRAATALRLGSFAPSYAITQCGADPASFLAVHGQLPLTHRAWTIASGIPDRVVMSEWDNALMCRDGWLSGWSRISPPGRSITRPAPSPTIGWPGIQVPVRDVQRRHVAIAVELRRAAATAIDGYGRRLPWQFSSARPPCVTSGAYSPWTQPYRFHFL